MTEFTTIQAKEGSVKRTYLADLGNTTEQKIFNCVLTTQNKTGASASPLYGKLDYKQTGSAEGQAQAITAEVIMADRARIGGQYQTIDLEIGGGSSTSFGSGTVSFIRCGVWGSGAITSMEDNGLFLDIQGISEGDGHLYSEGSGGGAAVTGTIRIRIGGNIRYIMTSTNAATD